MEGSEEGLSRTAGEIGCTVATARKQLGLIAIDCICAALTPLSSEAWGRGHAHSKCSGLMWATDILSGLKGCK